MCRAVENKGRDWALNVVRRIRKVDIEGPGPPIYLDLKRIVGILLFLVSCILWSCVSFSVSQANDMP